eukprot:Rmarinus@m.28184
MQNVPSMRLAKHTVSREAEHKTKRVTRRVTKSEETRATKRARRHGPLPIPRKRTSHKYNTRSEKLFLTDLPTDVLDSIFSRLPFEVSLLGGVAKVNREFREIALDQRTRNAVRGNFVKDHEELCKSCLFVKGTASFEDVNCAAFKGVLECFLYINYVTNYQYTYGKNFFGETLVHIAARNGHLNLIRYLWEEFPLLFWQSDQFGNTVLHWAAENGHLGIIRYVLGTNARALVSLKSRTYKTVLHVAASKGHVNVIRYFLRQGPVALFAEQDLQGRTALSYAAANGHLNVVRAIMDANLPANSEGPGDEVFLAFRVAVVNGHLNVVRYFVEQKEIMKKYKSQKEKVIILATKHVIRRYFA